MSKFILKKVIDVTGVELTPGEPSVCLGNGEQGFECCCDECDYFLRCFPEFDSIYKSLCDNLSRGRKKPSPVGEGGSRRLTDEEYPVKRETKGLISTNTRKRVYK